MCVVDSLRDPTRLKCDVWPIFDSFIWHFEPWLFPKQSVPFMIKQGLISLSFKSYTLK